MGRKGASRHRFALPNPRRTIPPAIFQTVSLERLSGNSERAPLRGLTSLRNRTKGHHFGRFALPKTRDPTRAAIFQTVSRTGIMRTSPKRRSRKFLSANFVSRASIYISLIQEYGAI